MFIGYLNGLCPRTIKYMRTNYPLARSWYL